MPAGLDMAPDAFRELLTSAFAHGFSFATAIAGICGLIAALALAIAVRGRRAAPAAAAMDEA
jgi:hypothetical protein